MSGWLLLAFSLLLAASSLLTTFKAPTLATWKLAILVGEFGAFAALPALALGAIAAAGGIGGIVRWPIAALCAVALLFLLRPMVQAARLARDLPARLTRAFGVAEVGRPPFRLGRLLSLRAEPKEDCSTLVFAHAGTPEACALDFYPPAAAAGGRRPAPCVVVVHGGGWDGGDRTQLSALNRHLAARGYGVAAVSYRLAPAHPWPAQRDDLLAAIAFLKAQAGALGIDPGRLVLFGRSAGGNLAEAVGYTAHDPAIRGIAAFYAPADLEFAWEYSSEDDVLNSFLLLRQFLGGTPQTAPAAFEAASAYFHVGRATPPTLLVHGTLDTLVWHRQSERLQARLAEHGVPNLFLSLPWATHAFEVNPHGPGGQLSLYALDHFLAAVTR